MSMMSFCRLPNGSLMEISKVYPLAAVYDTPEDVPEDVRKHTCIFIFSLIDLVQHVFRATGKSSRKSHWIHQEDDNLLLLQCSTAERTACRWCSTLFRSFGQAKESCFMYQSKLYFRDEISNTAAFLVSFLASAVTMGLAIDSPTLSA
ncbi:hypothetical protein BHM03_00033906 [Ensete ventricosum]|nr:hypothetical protein BHM03_00033906 [Ensete ventricosum]